MVVEMLEITSPAYFYFLQNETLAEFPANPWHVVIDHNTVAYIAGSHTVKFITAILWPKQAISVIMITTVQEVVFYVVP